MQMKPVDVQLIKPWLCPGSQRQYATAASNHLSCKPPAETYQYCLLLLLLLLPYVLSGG